MRFNEFQMIDNFLASPFGDCAMARFLDERGERMRGSPPPRKLRRMKPRQCFRNAAHLALEHDFRYCEGYGWCKDVEGFAFEHAWCVDPRSGAVVDVTWRDPASAIYLGVPVDTELLLAIMAETGVYGVLDHGRGFAFKTVMKHFGWSPAAR